MRAAAEGEASAFEREASGGDISRVEPSAFERGASGVSRSEPEHGTGSDAGAEQAHVPVLSDEVTFLLRPRRGGWVVLDDTTLLVAFGSPRKAIHPRLRIAVVPLGKLPPIPACA